jgi:hypothetical protein
MISDSLFTISRQGGQGGQDEQRWLMDYKRRVRAELDRRKIGELRAEIERLREQSLGL